MGTLVIADDHTLIRFSVKMLLERNGHLILGEATNGVEALTCAERYRPDVIILDLNMPYLDGLEVISRLTSSKCPSKILVLTASDAKNFALRCLKAGASGFVCKADALSDVVDAVSALLSGKIFFPESALQTWQEIEYMRAKGIRLTNRPTKREMDILQLLANGRGNQEIANTLMISHKTVSAYKIRLLNKFDTTHLISMIDEARRQGFLNNLDPNP